MSASLADRHLVVSAGPTFEDIDPVRFIGNRSSGKMGFAIAAVAAARGARVTLVAGPVHQPSPAGVQRVDVRSAAQMHAAVFAVGSDGTDGPTDAAGGYVDGGTLAALTAHGLTVFDTLQKNDAYHALQAADGLILTGPTGTNGNDVAVALVAGD